MVYAKELILRGLLSRGLDKRENGQNKIIAGTCNVKGSVVGRIFSINNNMCTLLWEGPNNKRSENYRKIRDELFGTVPYRTYGRAATSQSATMKPTTDASARTTKEPYFASNLNASTSEKTVEDIFAKHTDLIEPGLILEARQKNIQGKVIDLVFRDKDGFPLIVELKKGVAIRKDVGQLVEYVGYYAEMGEHATRGMLVAQRIPSSLGKAFEHFGIEYLVYDLKYIKNVLNERDDVNLARLVICE